MDSRDQDLVRVRSPADNALCSIHSGAMDRFNSVDELADFLVRDNESVFKSRGQKFTVLARRKITLPGGVIGNDVTAEIGTAVRSRRLYVLADGRAFAVDCEAHVRDWIRVEAAYQRVIASFTVLR